jgi:hypothetical protein
MRNDEQNVIVGCCVGARRSTQDATGYCTQQWTVAEAVGSICGEVY